jgi:hypothetical protein
MPRNTSKRRCRVPGCRAWAQRGHDLCASHHAEGLMPQQGNPIFPLLQNVSERASRPTPPGLDEDQALIYEELRELNQARTVMLSWISPGDEKEQAVSPAQFLRAWSDSTARALQLLRARRALAERRPGQELAELDKALDLLAQTYPALGEMATQRPLWPPA